MSFRTLVFVCLLLSGSTGAHGQTNRIDSLLKGVYAAKDDEQKLFALVNLCEEYQSLNRDSLDVYGPQIKELVQKSNNKRNISLGWLAYGNWYFRWGWSDSALVYIEPEISKNPVSNKTTRDIYFKLHRAKAFYLGSKSRFEEALAVLYKILPEAESFRDTLNIGLVSNTIGSVTLALGKPREALGWMNKAMNIAKGSRHSTEILAPAFINMGNAYADLNLNDSAVLFLKKALPLCKQLENLHYTATVLRVQSALYSKQGNYKEAEKSLLEMMAVRRKTSPISLLIDDNVELAKFYASTGQIAMAIKICKDNLQRGPIENSSNEIGLVLTNDPKVRIVFLEVLAGLYKQDGRPNEFAATMEELLAAKDSLYAANSVDAIATLQTQYEVQKKENTILQQKYDLQRKNFRFYSALVIMLIVLISAYIFFHFYRKQQQVKLTAMMEKEKRLSEEAIKQAEEKERTRIAADLHDNLGAHAASMAANISYIQMTDADDISKNAMYELRNNSAAIIAQLNDTIWVLKKEVLALTAVSDRLKTFINQLRRSYPDISIEVEEDIQSDIKLPASQAFHLYRMLQEAINNALKHSKGTKVMVRIVAGTHWEASVQDNGQGMSTSGQGSSGGFGLQNMKERSDEAGWMVSWHSLNHGGTKVLISPTTN
jgi:signal transduction histidine kinase